MSERVFVITEKKEREESYKKDDLYTKGELDKILPRTKKVTATFRTGMSGNKVYIPDKKINEETQVLGVAYQIGGILPGQKKVVSGDIEVEIGTYTSSGSIITKTPAFVLSLNNEQLFDQEMTIWITFIDYYEPQPLPTV